MYRYCRHLLLICFLLRLCVVSKSVEAQAAEPCANSPRSVLPGTHSRPSVEGDYLVIEYNAQSLQTFWYDYHHPADVPMAIDRNGSLMPVVYSKEKIAVHVCNLHFGDLLTVTTSPIGAPEGGADIRGTTPATIPSLVSTLDSLQSGATTGGTAPVSSLGFGATTPLGNTSISITGVTPGTVSYDKDGKPTYNGANVTASGEQVAIMMYSLETNAEAMVQAIYDNIAGWQPTGTSPEEFEPGSIGYLLSQATTLMGKVHDDSVAPGSSRNAAAFDRDITAVQSFSAELSTLANALSNQAFGARALAIQNNYAALRGILEFIDQGRHCTTPCNDFEKKKFNDFYKAYENKIKDFHETNYCTFVDAAAFNECAAKTQTEMFSALRRLGERLRNIDSNTSAIFNEMNDWNDRSLVEQTDLITPATGNALLRISLIVQRGYTPFLLANIASTAPASTTAPAVGSSPPSATTSTPPHAVKTILVEVHRLANFNLAGGMMVIHVPSTSYAVVAAPSPATANSASPTGWTGTCNGIAVNVPASSTSPSTPPAYSCAVATQKTQWQLAGMVGIVWYPWGHDYFPRHRGFSSYRRNLMPSLLLATSVTSLGNAIGAINWEPIGGIDLFGGIGVAHRNVLAGGITTTTALPSSYSLQTATQVHAGFATGVAFDLNVFLQLFQKTAPAGMP